MVVNGGLNMSIFKNKGSLEDGLKNQAERLGISTTELKKLGEGKICPKYGTKELLHARKVRGGKIVVFNISEKYRGEKISIGRKKAKNNEPKTQK